MELFWNRRQTLGAVAGGGFAACLPYTVVGQDASSRISVHRINDTLSWVSGAGGNVVVLAASEGTVLIDGGAPEHSADLLELITRQLHKKPIRTLFNTHWHPDHTGSNEALGAAETEIIAHENTRLWLDADFYVEWQDRRYKPRPPEALPTRTFYKSGEMTVGNEGIQYGHLPVAHTDGDIYVFFPRPNVLVAGDTLSDGRYPVIDFSTGGWLGGLIDANKKLLDVADAETRIVPGKGPMQTRADLQAQHDMLSTVMERLVQMMTNGRSAEEALAAKVTKEFDATWGDPEPFVSNAYESLWAHVYALEPRPI